MKVFAPLLFSFSLFCTQPMAQVREYTKLTYENGAVSSEGYMLNGKPEGYWKTYYPNGVLKAEGNRAEHALDSLWKFYSEDGVLRQSLWYQKGLKNGLRTTFDVTGTKTKEETFAADVLVGTVKKYYSSGKLAETIPIDTLGKGKEHGIGYEYDEEDERIVALIEYRNGFVANRERINRKDKFNQKQGLWRYFHENLTPMEEGRYKNDKKDGYWKTYDIEGNLLETLKYDNGILIPEPEELAKLDIKREYHPNAQVKSVGSYNKGVKEGVHREYSAEGEVLASKIYSKGKITGEGIVDAEGKRQGPWKEYYETGELRSEGRYKNGLREADWVFYYKDGKEEQRGSYVKGRPDGDWKWTHNNGQVWREEVFFDGLEEGMAIEYNDTGKVVAQGNYLSGEREGKWILDIGDQREEGTYVAGQRSGTWKHYYPNGKLSYEGKYEQGMENGKHTEYYESGQIKEVGLFKFGMKEGDWYSYAEDGTQLQVITYKQGLVVRIDGEKVVEVDKENEQ
ncbi:MAG: hypothetical protein RL266_95 [Bacteroidota bacterium]